MKKALIIIDVQNDFIPGGSLAVEEGNQIIPEINRLIPDFELVIATQDWHPSDHKSFASQHSGKNVFDIIDLNGMEQVLWPDHCIQGTAGAEFHKDLNMNMVEAIFRKGTDPEIDSYSGFFDNGHLKSTGLTGYLNEKAIEELHFCGLAADFCVYYSMKDALEAVFHVVLHENATRPINAENFEMQKAELRKNPNFKVIC